MISDRDLPHQQDTVQQQPPRSFKSLKLLVLLAAVLIAILIVGIGWYLLGTRTNQNVSQSTQVIPFQPTLPAHFQRSLQATWFAPVPTSTQAGPTPIFKLYRNERLGFELHHEKGFEAMEETVDKVSFGYIVPLLTVSTRGITDYKSYRPCEYIDEDNIQTLPCLERGERCGQEGSIIETTLGQVNAKIFYTDEYAPDGDYYPPAYYHIVQTADSPKIEAKMFVAGVGLDWYFKQMLSTFKILDSR
jgi:hypothetical protein